MTGTVQLLFFAPAISRKKKREEARLSKSVAKGKEERGRNTPISIGGKGKEEKEEVIRA